MASDAKVANALVTIVPTMEGARTQIADQVTDLIAPAGEAGGEKMGESLLSGLSGKLSTTLGPMLAGIVSTATLTAVTKALVDVGAEFDRMTDNIIIGTGATGAALEDMEQAARSVATSLPVSFSDAGQTVADLNTRLGLTGSELSDLSTKVSALGAIGQKLDINTLSGTMTAFGVSAEDVSDKLDYLWGVSQATGVGMNQMLSTMGNAAPQLTALGFSLEESANMVGLLDKAGINASSTLSSMSKALVGLAEPGQSAADAFGVALDQLQSFIDAGDEAAAIDFASSLFGTKGAPRFVAALQSGALSLDALRDSALGATGSIMGTYEATESWPEKFEIIKNKLLAAIEPLASALFDGLGGALDAVIASLDSIDPAVMASIGESLAQAATTAIPAIVDFAANALPGIVQGIATVAPLLGGIVTTAGPLVAIIGGLAGVVAPIVTAIGVIAPALPAIGAGIAALANPVTAVIAAVTALTAGVAYLWETNEDFRNGVMGIWDSITGFFRTAVDNIEGIGQGFLDFWRGVPDKILGFFSGIGDGISRLFEFIKLPHFSLHGSINPLDWPTQGLPGITVEWYANGGYISEPTALAIGGEAGGEWIVPDNPSKIQPFGDAIVNAMDFDMSEVVDILKEIRDTRQQIIMDTGELVGATIGATDSGLGARQNWAARGVTYAY